MSSILEHYRAIEQASRKMLALARDENWEGVADTRRHCDLLITELRGAVSSHVFSQADQAERMRLMRNIVVHEGEVRRLGCAIGSRLEQIFGSRADRSA